VGKGEEGKGQGEKETPRLSKSVLKKHLREIIFDSSPQSDADSQIANQLVRSQFLYTKL